MAVATKGIFIVGAKRTPFGRYGGLLSSTPAADMLAAAAADALAAAALSPDLVDSVNVGNTSLLSSVDGGLVPRHAALKAGVPLDKPALGVNRACGSGFQAVINGAQDILTGAARITLTGGSENMSAVPHVVRNVRFGVPLGASLEFEDNLAKGSLDTYCNTTMPVTAENLAAKFGLTREQVDEFALQSQQRWKEAFEAGVFKTETTPLTVTQKKKEVTVAVDEHPRPETTLAGLARLPALFKKNGVVTAGNSSGVNDGAGAIILASEEAVHQHRLTPLARLAGWGLAGVEPSVMGIGPVPAISHLLARTGLRLQDIDLIEINEAFAAQTLACVKALDIDHSKLNVNGGAISIGHPIAASGARITTHLVHELRRRGLKRAIGSACIGGGQGIALLIEAV